MDMLDAQKKFVTALVNSIPPGWQSVTIHFEYATIDGEQFEKFIARRGDAGTRSQFDLPLDALDALIEMNNIVPEGQSEKWSAVDFALDADGRYKFDFTYGVPPLVAQSLERTGA